MTPTRIAEAKRLVIKVGSALVTNNGAGLDLPAIDEWAKQIAKQFGKLKSDKKTEDNQDLEIEQLAHFSPEELDAIETLVNEHRISVYQAGEIVASLRRANKILMHGSFIYEMPEGDAQ